MNTLLATDFLEYIVDAVIVTDEQFRVQFWNKASEIMYGYMASEVLGRSLLGLLSTEYKHTTPEAVLAEFQAQDKWRGEVVQRHKSGRTIQVLASVAILKDKQQRHVGAIAINRDISDRIASEQALKQLNKQLERSAFHDHLTGLPNRRFLESIFEKHILATEFVEHSWFLVCLDLNGFKAVNDTFGHDVGDQLLIKVARRLKVGLRHQGYAARFGGDEFVILLQADSCKDVSKLLDRLALTVEHPIFLRKQSISPKVSMGLAEVSSVDLTFESVFRKADRAMYTAKNSRQTLVVYSGELTADSSLAAL